MDTAERSIKVTRNRPHEVTGDIALTPKRMVLSKIDAYADFEDGSYGDRQLTCP